MRKVSDITVAKKLISLMHSAQSREIEFNLSYRRVKALLRQEKCFYTGEIMTAEGPTQRTIDRVDASLGYIDSNVVACTQDINLKKTNLSVKEINLIYSKIKNRKK